MKQSAKVKEILKRMIPFYADLKRICETTNWEAGNCMQNEKQIHSFKKSFKNKNENNEVRDENKYEEKHEDTNTTT